MAIEILRKSGGHRKGGVRAGAGRPRLFPSGSRTMKITIPESTAQRLEKDGGKAHVISAKILKDELQARDVWHPE